MRGGWHWGELPTSRSSDQPPLESAVPDRMAIHLRDPVSDEVMRSVSPRLGGSMILIGCDFPDESMRPAETITVTLVSYPEGPLTTDQCPSSA